MSGRRWRKGKKVKRMKHNQEMGFIRNQKVGIPIPVPVVIAGMESLRAHRNFVATRFWDDRDNDGYRKATSKTTICQLVGLLIAQQKERQCHILLGPLPEKEATTGIGLIPSSLEVNCHSGVASYVVSFDLISFIERTIWSRFNLVAEDDDEDGKVKKKDEVAGKKVLIDLMRPDANPKNLHFVSSIICAKGPLIIGFLKYSLEPPIATSLEMSQNRKENGGRAD
ncbi:hypothetical protein L1887_12419 [Cichorium endivia]|nr:hypothetical protein L1887_12419 [Cichorium endivia]